VVEAMLTRSIPRKNITQADQHANREIFEVFACGTEGKEENAIEQATW